jgi:hypothetical protein
MLLAALGRGGGGDWYLDGVSWLGFNMVFIQTAEQGQTVFTISGLANFFQLKFYLPNSPP